MVYVNYDQSSSPFALPIQFSWGNGVLRVTNPASNKTSITQILGGWDLEGGPPNFDSGYMYYFKPGPMTAPDGSEVPASTGYCGRHHLDNNAYDGIDFTCTLADYASRTGGIPPGYSRTFTYKAETVPPDGDPPSELTPSVLTVFFNFRNAKDRCVPPNDSADIPSAYSARGPTGRAAAACPPAPSRPKIISAHIDRHDGTAAFRFKAHHVMAFICELYRGGRLMFQHACHSQKRYAHRLRHGQYTFRVYASSPFGKSGKAATKTFTL